MPNQTPDDLDFDSALRVAKCAFRHQLSFHSRVKRAYITQNPTIAAQAIISMIKVEYCILEARTKRSAALARQPI
jgi:hypothetical protein